MPKYQLTVTGDSLPELVGAVTEAAALLQEADAELTEAQPLPLPMPPAPDYVAAGLTEQQALEMRQRASGAAVYVPPAEAPPVMAGVPVANPQPAANGPAVPVCPIHAKEMVWKGGQLSARGKPLPLWSCPQPYCKEAIWPAR